MIRVWTAALILWFSASYSLLAADADFFEKRVRPLLAENCFACHSERASVAMGGLQLDSREAVLSGGGRGPAVVVGKPAESLLLRAVSGADSNLAMPPGGKLADAEVAALTTWVQSGAVWGVAPSDTESREAGVQGTYWSFRAPERPVIPKVRDSSWVRSPVDAFVLSALEDKDLRPAPPADKRTLIRRVTFDLIGLPPTIAEVQSFLADDSPDAFARVVDRLLASPRYGERWGRHWLDVARYADSNGLDENLVYKNAFRYRDYVIEAFNKDKPYDQFVQEQLAGDLMPSDDPETMFERWTATGFLSLGAKMLAEDDPVKMQMDIVDEQLDTTARTFLGLTVGCARCHDHKFDPIPTADYYAMAGIFKSSMTMENFNVVARWHEYVLAPKADRDQLQAHLDTIQAVKDAEAEIARRENHRLVTAAWEKAGDYLLAADDVLRSRADPLTPRGQRAREGGPLLRTADSFDRGNIERELERSEPNVPTDSQGPYFAEYDVVVDRAGDFQLDFLEQSRGSGTADVRINGILVDFGAEPVRNRAASPDEGGWSVSGVYPFRAGKNVVRFEHDSRFPYFRSFQLSPSELDSPPQTVAQVARRYDLNPGFLEQWAERLRRSQGAPASVLYGWNAYRDGLPFDAWASPAAKTFGTGPFADRRQVAARYQQLFSQAVSQWDELHPDAALDFTKRERYKDDDEAPSLPDAGLEVFRQILYEKYGPFRPPSGARDAYREAAKQELERLLTQRKELEQSTPEFPRAMGVREAAEIADIPVHLRGSHWTLGETVPRGFLTSLSGGKPAAIPRDQSGRLQLAQWMTSPNHPLTSRVMVNRIWRGHFGRGIVPSVDNFGRLGQRPDNQPLLDWLALEFIDQGWSVKQMHRTMLLSSTYRMSSRFDEQAASVDPENVLLWRMSRRRLEAEPMRDAIVAFSDDLDLTMGGSIMNFRDRQYVANTRARGGIDYDRNLRAVYLPVVRSSLYDVFRAFDFADPSTANGDRGSTVVAPQALFMMNGSLLLERTRMMADKLLAREEFDDAQRIQYAYERILTRPPDSSEVDQALTFVTRAEKAWLSHVEGPDEPSARAWQSFLKALISSNEFLYLN